MTASLAEPLADALEYPLTKRRVRFFGPVPATGNDVGAVAAETLAALRRDPRTLDAMAKALGANGIVIGDPDQYEYDYRLAAALLDALLGAAQ